MDEAKSLVHMSVSAIFSAMFLAAAMGLITVCYLMWSYFSRQDAANQRLDYYSNLTAYDNQTIGGADALSLLSHAEEYGLFVIFLEDNDPTQGVFDSVNNVKNHNLNYIYFDPDGQGAYTTVSSAGYSNAMPVANNAINQVYSAMGGGTLTAHDLEASGYENLYGRSKAELIHLFTTSTTDGLGSLTPTTPNSYATFKAVLIYANDGTTDVAGVALVRAGAGVTNFCVNN